MIFGKRKKSGRMLLIHVGDHKTGSTTIQNAFAKGCVEIEGETPFFPTRLNHNFLPSALENYYNGSDVSQRTRGRATLTKQSQRFKKASEKYNLISGEMLERTPPKHVKQFVNDFLGSVFDEVRVIAYVRPHTQRLLSGYAEVTKIGGSQRSLPAFCDGMKKNGRLQYAKRFQVWRDTFGEQFTLRPMIRSSLTNSSLLDDFIIHGFGTTDFSIRPFDDDNESLALHDLMFLKALQSRISKQPKTVRHTFGREVAHHLGQQPKPTNGEKLRMHTELAQSIADHYADDARLIDDAFFDGEPLLTNGLKTALTNTSPEMTSTDPADHFTANELRHIHTMGDLINMMMNADDTNWTKIFNKARIDALHEN